MIQNSNTKLKVFSSLVWKLMERSGTQGIQFIVQIILARLLLPKDFGMITLVLIFILVANVFVQSGFNTALIQKKRVEEIDFSSVFYLSLTVASILYTSLFFCAPLIAEYYGMPSLVRVTRVLALTLFLGAFNSIQNAIIARSFAFKKLFFSSLGAVLISGIIGIAMAYAGFGVWALVTHQIISQLLVTITLWFRVRWRPKLLFSFSRIKALFLFSWKILLSDLMDTLFDNLRSLIIGKMYSPDVLGFYNRGKQFPSVIITNINGSIQSVMLPALSSNQDDIVIMKSMMRRSISISSFLIFPVMVGLAVIAKPLVILILTEKWLPSVPFLQIFCLIYALRPLHTTHLQAIISLGRSDVSLKLQIIKTLLGLLVLGMTIQFGVYAIALGGAVSGLLTTLINAYPNRILLNYSYKEQWKDIRPSLLLSLLIGTIAYSIELLKMSAGLTLIAQMFIGLALYVVISTFLKLESFTYMVSTVRNLHMNRKKVHT